LEQLFSEKVGQMSEQLAGDVATLQAEPDSADAMDDIYRIAHSLHGAGTMYGFPAVSELGASLEKLAGELQAGRLSAATPILDLIRSAAGALEHAVHADAAIRDAHAQLSELAWECECAARDTATNGEADAATA
jgi:two-component system, chemotaxis family, sensor kinase CheA